MKDVALDGDGNLVCPKCGSKNLDRGSTLKGKVGGGLLFAPKRVKCVNCGYVSKPGDAKPVSGQAARNTDFAKEQERLRHQRLVRETEERIARAAAPPAVDGIPAQIEKLGELRDKGLLTEEEFATKKAELLGRL